MYSDVDVDDDSEEDPDFKLTDKSLFPTPHDLFKLEVSSTTTVDDLITHVLTKANSGRARQILRENLILCVTEDESIIETFQDTDKVEMIDTDSNNRYGAKKIACLMETRNKKAGANEKTLELNWSKATLGKRAGIN